ncbi:hypothetical protein PG630_08455 [Riemerella anatipestifer]|nr:hypothetical protein [Riemerella anatipestifer]
MEDWLEKGMRSIWKAHYDIIDENNQLKYSISADNNFVGEIPILSFLLVICLILTISVKDTSGKTYFQLKKNAFFFRYKIST